MIAEGPLLKNSMKPLATWDSAYFGHCVNRTLSKTSFSQPRSQNVKSGSFFKIKFLGEGGVGGGGRHQFEGQTDGKESLEEEDFGKNTFS